VRVNLQVEHPGPECLQPKLHIALDRYSEQVSELQQLLWCEVRRDQLRVPPEKRNSATQLRSLHSLEQNYTNFMTSDGGDLPGLHISLGIFHRLFSLLEDACHRLDVKAAESADQQQCARQSSYSDYGQVQREIAVSLRTSTYSVTR
jgi:hypothetical protein